MNEDEAFVYLWQDAREKPYRYYLGYHKGNPDDNYTHSSTIFESFTKDSIPDGVRRRILATGTAEEMMELENKLLNNRKESKWEQYYNVAVCFPPYMWGDPEYRKMKSEESRKRWQDPEYRKMMSEESRKRWQDSEYRKMMSEMWQDPEFIKMQSERTKKLWKDPEFSKMQSEKMSELNKKRWQDPEYRKMMSEESRKRYKDPEYRKMKSEELRKRWQDPEFIKMQSERTKKQWKDPEYRERISELNKKRWQDPEFRKMMSEKMSETCVHCGFISTRQNIGRWHNDKCKYKDQNTLKGFF